MKTRRKAADRPSPAAIAAAIPRPPELVEAEQRAIDLQAEREAIIARISEIEWLIADEAERPAALAEARIIVPRRHVVEQEINNGRLPLSQMRQAHERTVSAALADRTVEAAEGILAAVETIRGHVAEINEINAAIWEASGLGKAHMVHASTGGIEAEARRVLARVKAR